MECVNKKFIVHYVRSYFEYIRLRIVFFLFLRFTFECVLIQLQYKRKKKIKSP